MNNQIHDPAALTPK